MRCSRLAFPSAWLSIYPLSSLFLDYDKSNGWNVAAFTIYYPVVVLVPRPFARAKFTESINSVAPREQRRRIRDVRETRRHMGGNEKTFIATAPRVIHAFIQRNFNEISTELHRSLDMSSRIVSRKLLKINFDNERRTKASTRIEWFKFCIVILLRNLLVKSHRVSYFD